MEKEADAKTTEKDVKPAGTSTTSKRKVDKKDLFVGKMRSTVGGSEVIELVGGTFAGKAEAVAAIKDNLPPGDYILVYLGATVKKAVRQVADVEVG